VSAFPTLPSFPSSVGTGSINNDLVGTAQLLDSQSNGTSSTTASPVTPSLISSLTGAASSVAVKAMSLSSSNPLNDFIDSYDLEDFLFILLGIGLLAAGIFSLAIGSDNLTNAASNSVDTVRAKIVTTAGEAIAA
jgi:hypothetical protein